MLPFYLFPGSGSKSFGFLLFYIYIAAKIGRYDIAWHGSSQSSLPILSFVYQHRHKKAHDKVGPMRRDGISYQIRICSRATYIVCLKWSILTKGRQASREKCVVVTLAVPTMVNDAYTNDIEGICTKMDRQSSSCPGCLRTGDVHTLYR